MGQTLVRKPTSWTGDWREHDGKKDPENVLHESLDRRKHNSNMYRAGASLIHS